MERNDTYLVKLDAAEFKYVIAYYLENQNINEAIKTAKEALFEFPNDADLLYLTGTLYADIGLFDEAKDKLKAAVKGLQNPYPAVFQLGLMHYTSGQFDLAESVWRDLEALPENHYLLRFSYGLTALLQDELDHAVTWLEHGMAENNELPALNDDMQVVIERIQSAQGNSAAAAIDGNHVLLSGYQK